MSSELPYEAPTATRNASADEVEAGMPLDPRSTITDVPRPRFDDTEVTPLPDGTAEETAKLLQALASYERQEIERVLGGFYDKVMQVFDERLVSLHDPKSVFLEGVRYGAAAVLAALAVLLVVGLLFLFGLHAVRAL
jgi:hypothetical protein